MKYLIIETIKRHLFLSHLLIKNNKSKIGIEIVKNVEQFKF